MDINTTQAILTCRIVCEYFVFIPVKTVQTVLRSKPNKSLIVLHDLKNSCLGQASRCRETREADIVAINYRQSDARQAALRLSRHTGGSGLTVRLCPRQPAREGNQR